MTYLLYFKFQACLVIDYLYDIPCKMLHVNKGDDLANIVDSLRMHFDKFGSPVMMGGDVDCSSKGIMGIHVGSSDTYLLVVVRRESFSVIFSGFSV